MKKYFLSLLIILNVSLIFSESPGSFREKDTKGLGFGYESPGYVLFYDFVPKYYKIDLGSNFRVHTYIL